MWHNYQSAVFEYRILNQNQNPNIQLPNYSKTHSPNSGKQNQQGSIVKKMELDWTCVKNGRFQALHDGNDMEAGSRKPEGRRRVGHPKTIWRRTVKKERNSLEWRSWNEAKRVASDRMN